VDAHRWSAPGKISDFLITTASLHAASAWCGINDPAAGLSGLQTSHGLKTVARIQQVWESPWKRWENFLDDRKHHAHELFRMIANTPDVWTGHEGPARFYERHSFCWHFFGPYGFPFTRQNRGSWGLGDEMLPETTLASAEWEGGAAPTDGICFRNDEPATLSVDRRNRAQR
jgi:hypothetical protein